MRGTGMWLYPCPWGEERLEWRFAKSTAFLDVPDEYIRFDSHRAKNLFTAIVNFTGEAVTQDKVLFEVPREWHELYYKVIYCREKSKYYKEKHFSFDELEKIFMSDPRTGIFIMSLYLFWSSK